jgi:hypothetical protein
MSAILETDWTTMQDRILSAEVEIHRRRLELCQDEQGTEEERQAIVDAMRRLSTLRVEAALWLESQNKGSPLACFNSCEQEETRINVTSMC